MAGCALLGLDAHVIGVSADDPADAVEDTVRAIVSGMGEVLGMPTLELARRVKVEVDDTFVGDGYELTAKFQKVDGIRVGSDANDGEAGEAEAVPPCGDMTM